MPETYRQLGLLGAGVQGQDDSGHPVPPPMGAGAPGEPQAPQDTAAAPGGRWWTTSSGVVVPAGSLVTIQLDEDARAEKDAEIYAAAEKRGLHSTPLPRRAHDRAQVEAWADFLEPHFGQRPALNLTGTYSDAYGYSNGLMRFDNVIKDYKRFLRMLRREREAACIGVELAPQGKLSGRPILHFHGLVGGNWSLSDCERIEALWAEHRGWARAKLTNDRAGCIEYAAKHLLKQGAADNFDFWPSSRRPYASREARRQARAER